VGLDFEEPDIEEGDLGVNKRSERAFFDDFYICPAVEEVNNGVKMR
jgi:hypothetical protein